MAGPGSLLDSLSIAPSRAPQEMRIKSGFAVPWRNPKLTFGHYGPPRTAPNARLTLPAGPGMFRFLMIAAMLLLPVGEVLAHGEESAPPPPKKEAPTFPVHVIMTRHGSMLVDSRGMTLY